MCVFQHGERGISIHSLRMEGDMRSSICGGTRKNFNPLPPHGGRPTVIAFYFGTQTISIHSLRMEGDSRKTLTIMYFVSFQSTPSAWRETAWFPFSERWLENISIHSLRMEGDNTPYIFSKASFAFQSTPSAWRETDSRGITGHASKNFNPLPPHGGRRILECTH